MDRLKQQVLSQGKKRRKTNRPKLSVIAAYSGVFIVLVSLINIGYQAPKPTASVANVSSEQPPFATPAALPTPEASKSSIDELVATNIAVNIAESSDMLVSGYLNELAVNLENKKNMDQTSDASIVKPDIAQIGDSRTEIVNHTVKDGETLESIAAQYGVSVQTIQWSNSLTGTTVSAGKVLVIPPVDGFTYKVKAGDSIESIATAYKTSVERIRSLNNLEKGGLTPGVEITIPGGDLPTNQRPGYVAPVVQPRYYFAYNSDAMNSSAATVIGYGVSNIPYGGRSATSLYAAGNCTAYAYDRRGQLGMPLPANTWGNAYEWLDSARRAGYGWGLSPKIGAIAYWKAYAGSSGYYGHVGIVESISEDGSRVTITDMNYLGRLNTITQRTVDASGVTAYIY